jgi:hypothetical protein
VTKHVKHDALDPLDRGIVVGLVVGEASFTGDGKQAQLAISMHVRHERLLQWLADVVPGSRLYGPYHHSNRHFYRWMVRGTALADFLAEYEDDIRRVDDHVASRIDEMRDRYGTALRLR